MKRRSADAFWRFSLMVYGLWLAVCEGGRLDAAALSRARGAMARLDRDVVQKLRRLRAVLKDDPDEDIRALRHRVLALELAAERRVQTRLASCAAPGDGGEEADRQTLAEGNLRLILGNDIDSPAGDVLRQAITKNATPNRGLPVPLPSA
jgi:uncharacterized protein (TIGR02444 family)